MVNIILTALGLLWLLKNYCKLAIPNNSLNVLYSLEEIYLFVNPVLKNEEGTVHRLEKCGEKKVRLLVTRSYRVVCDRIIKATVHPLNKEIKAEELTEKELVFEGSTAYDIAPEIEHLKKKEIKGESLLGFKFLK